MTGSASRERSCGAEVAGVAAVGFCVDGWVDSWVGAVDEGACADVVEVEVEVDVCWLGVVCVIRSGRSGASGMTGSASRERSCGAEVAGVAAVGFCVDGWVDGWVGAVDEGACAGVTGVAGSVSRDRSCGADVAGVEPGPLVDESVEAGVSGFRALRLRRARNAGAALGATSTGRGA